jgi:HEAT repeat protein
MQALFETARIAIERQDWDKVNTTLQKLLSNPQEYRENSLPTADDILDIALRTLRDCDFQQRWEIAKLFPKMGKRAIAPLIDLLTADVTDVEMRWFIVKILGEFDDRACILALSQLIHQEEELAEIAAEALANIGRSAMASLAELLQDPATRLLGVRALSRVRRPEIVAPLLTVVNDDSAAIRAIAIEALSSFQEERIGTVVLAALKDPSALVRRQAVMATGYLARQSPQENLVPALEPLLWDLDRDICHAVAIALGRIGTAEAARVLFSVCRSPLTPDDLKLTLVRALGWIETAEVIGYLERSLYGEDPRICQEIITILARQNSSRARQQAVRVLGDFYHAYPLLGERTAIKQSLALALGELADTDSQGILRTLAKDSEAIVRLHALSALKKLDRQAG